MAYELGKDWRIHVGDGASPTEVFSQLGGEGSFEFQRSAQEIDLSTKDDADYALADFGLQKISISVSGYVKLPNTALEALTDKAKATDKRVNLKIMDGAVVKYAGQVAVGGQGISAGKDGAVAYSFSLVASAAPTTDDMAATA